MDTLHVSADFNHLCERAIHLMDAGRAGAAQPLVAAAHALCLSSAELDLLEGRLAVAQGELDRAILTLDNGVTRNPCHPGLRKYRANLRRQMGDWNGAATDAAEAVVLNQHDPDAKAILGRVMLDLGRYAEATSCLDEAVRVEPTNSGYYESLALVLEKSGDAEAALQALNNGIALCPNGISLRNAAIVLCVRRRDFLQAVRLAERARSMGVADSSTFGLKGHALSSLGCDDEAAVAYREALNLDPENLHLRHLVAASGAMPASKRAPAGFIRTVFDGYAERFDSHLEALEYSLPAAIRSLLLAPPTTGARQPVGPVLDLGCGTGMIAEALEGLPIGPFTGVDLSGQMLRRARDKRLYMELRQADIVDELDTDQQTWPLIIAADVLCYFGSLDQILSLVYERLDPGGWFIFSVEQICPGCDSIRLGNGRWELQRQGRYAHSESYVSEIVRSAGLRVVQIRRLIIRQEAGGPVPGILLAAERPIDNG